MEGETPNVVHNLHKIISKTSEKAHLTTISRFEVIIAVRGGGLCVMEDPVYLVYSSISWLDLRE